VAFKASGLKKIAACLFNMSDELLRAVQTGDATIVAKCLATERPRLPVCVLKLAVVNDRADVVHVILGMWPFEDREALLEYAVKYESMHVVAALLTMVKVQVNEGAIGTAIARQCVPMLRLLVACKADVNRFLGARTCLEFAATHGCPHIVQLLLDAQADVHATCWTGANRALMAAVDSHHPAVVRILLQAKGDVNNAYCGLRLVALAAIDVDSIASRIVTCRKMQPLFSPSYWVSVFRASRATFQLLVDMGADLDLALAKSNGFFPDSWHAGAARLLIQAKQQREQREQREQHEQRK
jgi:hypothetical protein